MSAWLAAQQTGLWPEVWVLECSSFQLHSMQDLHPDVATVLNISQDHLDWHVSASDYQNDKMRLLQQAKRDRKSTRLNSSHVAISYAVFCLKKKKNKKTQHRQ